MHESPPSPTTAKAWGMWTTLGLSWVVLIVFLATQTLVIEAVSALQSAQNPDINSTTLAQNRPLSGFSLAAAILVSAPICLALTVWLIRLRKQLSMQEYLALRKPKAEVLARCLLIAVVFLVAADLLKSLVDRPIVSSLMTSLYETAGFLPIFWVAIGLLAPVFEEVLFRGFLYKGLQRSALGYWGIIVLPAGIWTLIHMQYDWGDMLEIFGFGMLLGVARLRTSSLYVPIAMHILNNLLSLIQVAIQPT
jgi:uncharacterized protein